MSEDSVEKTAAGLGSLFSSGLRALGSKVAPVARSASGARMTVTGSPLPPVSAYAASASGARAAVPAAGPSAVLGRGIPQTGPVNIGPGASNALWSGGARQMPGTDPRNLVQRLGDQFGPSAAGLRAAGTGAAVLGGTALGAGAATQGLDIGGQLYDNYLRPQLEPGGGQVSTGDPFKFGSVAAVWAGIRNKAAGLSPDMIKEIGQGVGLAGLGGTLASGLFSPHVAVTRAIRREDSIPNAANRGGEQGIGTILGGGAGAIAGGAGAHALARLLGADPQTAVGIGAGAGGLGAVAGGIAGHRFVRGKHEENGGQPILSRMFPKTIPYDVADYSRGYAGAIADRQHEAEARAKKPATGDKKETKVEKKSSAPDWFRKKYGEHAVPVRVTATGTFKEASRSDPGYGTGLEADRQIMKEVAPTLAARGVYDGPGTAGLVHGLPPDAHKSPLAQLRIGTGFGGDKPGFQLAAGSGLLGAAMGGLAPTDSFGKRVRNAAIGGGLGLGAAYLLRHLAGGSPIAGGIPHTGQVGPREMVGPRQPAEGLPSPRDVTPPGTYPAGGELPDIPFRPSILDAAKNILVPKAR